MTNTQCNLCCKLFTLQGCESEKLRQSQTLSFTQNDLYWKYIDRKTKVEMRVLTWSLFTPRCPICKDSVHGDLIQGEGTPIHLLPNGIASSRGEGWRSCCQADGEVLQLIIAVDGGKQPQQARGQTTVNHSTSPFFHFLVTTAPSLFVSPSLSPVL